MPTTVTVRSGEELARLRARAGDRKTLGTIVARILESHAQRAFVEQRLGDFAWPERYPTMEDPFVNVAALVNWLNHGGSVISRFFDRRPALMGTGTLSRSISGRVKSDLVEVGSSLPYAGIHQWGGTSRQPVTQAAKDKIRRFIRSERGKRYAFKLWPVLGKDQIETQVNQRPFLGITPEMEQMMAEDIEDFVSGAG